MSESDNPELDGYAGYFQTVPSPKDEQIKALQATIAQLQGEIKKAYDKLHARDDEHAQLQAENKELKEEIKKLQKDLGFLCSQISRRNEKIAQLRNNIKKLTQE